MLKPESYSVPLNLHYCVHFGYLTIIVAILFITDLKRSPLENSSLQLSPADIPAQVKCPDDINVQNQMFSSSKSAEWPMHDSLFFNKLSGQNLDIPPPDDRHSVWQCTATLLQGLQFVEDFQSIYAAHKGTNEDVLKRQYNTLQDLTEKKEATISMSDFVLFHKLISILKVKVTIETGFANGGSAVAFLSALPEDGVHMSIDPYQAAWFKQAGLAAVKNYFLEHSQSTKRYYHINETTAYGLGVLLRNRRCVDLFFLDDGHKFDDNLLELYHAHRMLKIGGILMIHDTWMASVKATSNWIEKNLSFRKIDGIGNEGVAIFVKIAKDSRKWTHYVGFDATETSNSGFESRLETNPKIISSTVTNSPQKNGF